MASPAIRAALAAEAGPGLEARWRLQQLQLVIDPLTRFRPALELAAAGKLEAAIGVLEGIVDRLPGTTRPDPRWTLEIFGDVVRYRRLAGASSGIADLNLFLLLREAGLHAEPVRRRALASFASAGDPRSTRLRAVLSLYPPDRKPGAPLPAAAREAAERLWTRGLKGAGDEAFYLEYERGMWAAHCGDREAALRHLRRAATQPTHREEARKSSDYFPLVRDPDFRAIIDGKPRPGAGGEGRGARPVRPK